MIASGKTIRYKRIFRENNRSLIVAMDHGIMGITEGIENIGSMIDIVTQSGADAVMVNVGIVKNYYNRIAGRIGLVATIEYEERNVEEAVKIGANAVKTTYFGKVPPDEFKRLQIKQIAFRSEEWGIPFMAELVPADTSGNTIYDVDLVKKSARICAELGADIVKTAYTGTQDGFKKVVKSCPIPIVIAGGPKLETDRETLKMVKDSVLAGGAGVAVGRNIWQHRNPAGMTKAIAGIIHDDLSVDEAMRILK